MVIPSVVSPARSLLREIARSARAIEEMMRARKSHMLLVPQGFDGIEPGRLPSRIDAKKEPDNR